MKMVLACGLSVIIAKDRVWDSVDDPVWFKQHFSIKKKKLKKTLKVKIIFSKKFLLNNFLGQVTCV